MLLVARRLLGSSVVNHAVLARLDGGGAGSSALVGATDTSLLVISISSSGSSAVLCQRHLPVVVLGLQAVFLSPTQVGQCIANLHSLAWRGFTPHRLPTHPAQLHAVLVSRPGPHAQDGVCLLADVGFVELMAYDAQGRRCDLPELSSPRRSQRVLGKGRAPPHTRVAAALRTSNSWRCPRGGGVL